VTEDKALMTRLSENHYDIVLVNIVADVIIGLSPVLPHFLDETSAVICSGILDTRLQDVTAALEKAGLEITSVREKEDWRCVTAKRRV
jgi:ribosomal protein L11 methyltransferase